MDDMMYILFISIFVPIMLMANLIEKKARLPIIFVLVGMFISVMAAEVNGVVSGLMSLSNYELISIVTPMRWPFRTKRKRCSRPPWPPALDSPFWKMLIICSMWHRGIFRMR